MLPPIEVLRLSGNLLNEVHQRFTNRTDRQPFNLWTDLQGIYAYSRHLAALEIYDHNNYSAAIGHLYIGAIALEKSIPYTFQGKISFNLLPEMILIPLLSGHKVLITRFSDETLDAYQNTEQEAWTITFRGLQACVRGDMNDLQVRLDHLKSRMLKRTKAYAGYLDFFESVLSKDQDQFDRAIRQLLSTHRYRDDSVVPYFVSFELCGLLKTGRMFGLESAVKNPVINPELVLFSPSDDFPYPDIDF